MIESTGMTNDHGQMTNESLLNTENCQLNTSDARISRVLEASTTRRRTLTVIGQQDKLCVSSQLFQPRMISSKR